MEKFFDIINKTRIHVLEMKKNIIPLFDICEDPETLLSLQNTLEHIDTVLPDLTIALEDRDVNKEYVKNHNATSDKSTDSHKRKDILISQTKTDYLKAPLQIPTDQIKKHKPMHTKFIDERPTKRFHSSVKLSDVFQKEKSSHLIHKKDYCMVDNLKTNPMAIEKKELLTGVNYEKCEQKYHVATRHNKKLIEISNLKCIDDEEVDGDAAKDQKKNISIEEYDWANGVEIGSPFDNCSVVLEKNQDKGPRVLVEKHVGSKTFSCYERPATTSLFEAAKKYFYDKSHEKVQTGLQNSNKRERYSRSTKNVILLLHQHGTASVPDLDITTEDRKILTKNGYAMNVSTILEYNRERPLRNCLRKK